MLLEAGLGALCSVERQDIHPLVRVRRNACIRGSMYVCMSVSPTRSTMSNLQPRFSHHNHLTLELFFLAGADETGVAADEGVTGDSAVNEHRY